MSITRTLLALAVVAALSAVAVPQEKSPFIAVVMDPLAAQLSCPCVKGYAQRDYEQLGKYLEQQLGRPVKVYFSEGLAVALQKKTGGKVDLVIGKESVVRHDSIKAKVKTTAIAALTGKDGKTTQTGLFVVAATDPALTVSDLKGYQILFGPEDSDEKHTGALHLLRDFEVAAPKKLETCNSCSDGATKILELHKGGGKATAVISSYAQPLLEGCGTIKKGELRVIGETDPLPFIVAFVNEAVPAGERTAIQQALFAVGRDAKLCEALETKNGFVKIAEVKKK